MIFVGIDWAEGHHDVFVGDREGRRLTSLRIGHGVEGVAALHAAVAAHVEDPEEVVVGIETDRGLLVRSLVDAGYQVYAINPRAVDRYRDRHVLSGAKSDARDALVLSELVRTDRQHHRRVAGDSDDVEGLKMVTRGHQNLIWARTRHILQLRTVLLEYYPAMVAAGEGEVGSRDILAVLKAAPDPAAGAKLSKSQIATVLRRAGRQRNVAAVAERIQTALRAAHLQAADCFSSGCVHVAKALVAVIGALNDQINVLHTELKVRLEGHRDAATIISLPGLGPVLGARLLAEFGDDRARYDDARARRNYAGTSPITRASGKTSIVLARHVRNRRLADACDRWAFASLAASPGARRYYDELRAAGKSHRSSLRALANRLVGVLHGCLQHNAVYNESVAWKRYHPLPT